MSRLTVGLLLALAVLLCAAADGGGQGRVNPADVDAVCAVHAQVLKQPMLGEGGRAEVAPAPPASDGARGTGDAAVAKVSLARDAATQYLPESSHPRMFVAIFTGSGVAHIFRRFTVRKAWHSADWMTVRFMVCSRPRKEQKEGESQQNHDMVFLDCADKYLRGALTKKAVLSMRHYLREYPKVPYYFKTDDDTFVQPGPLLSRVEAYKESQHLYGGLMDPDGKVERSTKSQFYEDPSIFPDGAYPPTALGGPGYVLSQDLVKQILDRGLPDKHLLYNEDRAVAVWVRAVNESNVPVSYVGIDGENGYSNHCQTVLYTAKWKDFHWVLFHKLSILELACVGNRWPDDADVRHCFCR